MRPERWLEIAGFGMWVVSAVPAVLNIASGELSGPAVWVWGVAFVAFGLAFAAMCWCQRGWRRSRATHIVLMLIQSVTALTMVATGLDVMPAGLLVVVAGQLSWVFAHVGTVLWVLAQSAALVAIGTWFASLADALALGGAFAGFQIFALATASLAMSERRSREELARANAELHATRAMLAESSRAEERLRISRDLHDTLGHHLTALSLQLDVASRVSDGKAAGHVRQAHAITRLLLSDVRDVVSTLRDTRRVDLADAIRALAAAPSGVEVHLELPPALDVQDGDRAQALLRCVQEIITNASRHAQARNLWIRIEERPDGIALHARDDGHGAAQLSLGHGLTGMRERFAALAGSVEFDSRPETGFEIRGFMPTPHTAS